MNLTGEPNNNRGTSNYIAERCINGVGTSGFCLNDEHCEHTFTSICEIGTEEKDYRAGDIYW